MILGIVMSGNLVRGVLEMKVLEIKALKNYHKNSANLRNWNIVSRDSRHSPFYNLNSNLSFTVTRLLSKAERNLFTK